MPSASPRRMALLWVMTGAMSAACSSTTTNGASPSPAALSATFASAYCDYYERCDSLAIRAAYGDVASCKSTLSARSQITLAAKGMSISSSQMDQCAAMLRTVACELIDTRAECRFRGTLTDGTSCAANGQCASGSCFHPTVDFVTTECGTCAPEVGDGADCANNDCRLGLSCVADKCMVPAAEGEACSEAKPCASAYDCIAGKCTKPLPVGAACGESETAPDCDRLRGVVCAPATGGARTCQEVRLAAVGEECELHSTTGLPTGCFASFCSNGVDKGTCTAFAAEGEACSIEGPACAPGTACKDDVCAKPNPSACN